MSNHYVNKDGWHLGFNDGIPIWIETNPTYTTTCKRCHGAGRVDDDNCRHRQDYDYMGWGCDCMISCSCRGGYTKDPHPYPQPDLAIISKVSDALKVVMKEYGKRLDDGSLEEEISKEKSLNDSMTGASL
jgi:hypothetical protein